MLVARPTGAKPRRARYSGDQRHDVPAGADASPYFVSCNTMWGHLMFKLKEAAERGGPARPLFTKSGMDTLSAGGY